MPIYEYKCPKCGKVFEEWVKSSEAHKEEKCPVCGTPSPRIMSRTSFVLKGDGWYVSDYGYRKGITEDSGSGADVPAPAKPTTPAKQGDKSVSKLDDAPKKDKPTKKAGTEKKPANATKSDSASDTAKS